MHMKAPIDEQILEFTFPRFQRFVLNNGLTLIVVEHHELPEVNFRMGIKVGTKYVPEPFSGAAELISELLKKGSENYTYQELVEKIDFIGAALETTVSEDFFYVLGKFLVEHFEIAMELLREVVCTPQFPEEELDKERARMIANLQNERSSPHHLAQRQMDKRLYHPHPYSFHKTEATLQSITRDLLVQIHQKYFTPENSVLVITGDITPDDARVMVEKYLGNWERKAAPSEQFPRPDKPQKRIIHLIHRPDSEQVTVSIGVPAFPQNHPDFIPAQVANYILGGGSSGRLFQNLREKKGYTYGAYSALELLQDAGSWLCEADVRTEVVDKALELFLEELSRLRDELVEENELKVAHRYLIGSFPLKNETPHSIASLILKQQLYHLPEDFWNTYTQSIGEVDRESIRRIAQQYIDVDRLQMVVVGDGRQIVKQMEPFGELKLFDVHENELSLSKL